MDTSFRDRSKDLRVGSVYISFGGGLPLTVFMAFFFVVFINPYFRE